MNEFVKEIASTMKQSKTKAYDTVAKVLRVDEKTAYVHIDGGADETPAQMAINCKTGDTVKIRVSGGKAWITGNITAPPTDDSAAEVAQRAAKAVAKSYGEFADLTVENFKAVNADIEKLNTKKLDAESADIKFANIDFSNIGKAAMEYFYAQSGLIKDVVVGDQKITGHLIGVTISGDLIEGNTVKAEKLVVLGEDGLYYKLNVNALGEATASSDKKYQNGLDGSVIIAKSVTAEKVSVKDLVAFGATIGGLNITDGSLYSGVKDSINNTTQGFYMDKNGQLYLGDAENFLKYYRSKDGTYKLAISAKSVTFGSNQNLEEAWEETKTSIESKIETVDVEYYLSTSPTSLSGGSWSTVAPTWTDGKYMWMRTKITDGAGNVTYSPDENGTCISGATGATGSSGKGITSIIEEYYQSTSATTLSGGSWSTTAPTWVDGKYIWTRSVITYTDSTVERTEGICATGQKGDKGATGAQGPQGAQGEKGEKGDKGDTGPRGLQGLQGERGEQGIPGPKGADGASGATSYFHIKYSPVDNPTSSSQLTEIPNTYIGVYVDFSPDDSTDPSKYKWSRLTGAQGPKGEQGIPGIGVDGKTSYLHIAYANSSDGKTGFSISDSTDKLFIGQYTDFSPDDSTDPSKYKWTLVKGSSGEDGSNFAWNLLGGTKDFDKTKIEILSTASFDSQKYLGLTVLKTISPENSYIDPARWDNVIVPTPNTEYTISFYAKASISTYIASFFYPNCTVKNVSNHQITESTDGRVVTKISTEWNRYSVTWTTSNSVSGPKSIIPVRLESDIVPKNVTVYFCGVKMEQSNKSSSWCTTQEETIGEKGDTGNGIKSTDITYQVWPNGTSTPSGTWTSTPPDTSAENPYLWTKTVITYTDGNTSTSYSVGSTVKGVDVGGRNLFINSTLTNPENNDFANYEIGYINNCHIYGKTENGLHFSTNQTGNNDSNGTSFIINRSISGLKTGDVVTFSADLKGTIGTGYPLMQYWGTTSSDDKFWARRVFGDSLSNIKNDSYTRLSVSVTLNDLHPNDQRDYFCVGGAYNSDIYVKNIKLEKGNIATDWSLATEDVDSAVDEAAKTATNFMKYEDGTGLIVGDMRGDTLGQNTLLDSSGMAVRNSSNEIVRFGTAPIVITNTDGDKTYDGSGSVMQSDRNIVVSTQQTKNPDDVHSGGKAALELYYDKTKDITGISLTVKGGSTYSDLYESMGTGMYVDNNHIQVVSDDVECILGKNNILWDAHSVGYWMNASHKFTLDQPISEQLTGAVFVWSHYDTNKHSIDNWWWISFFVPKQHVAWRPGDGMLMCNPYYGLNKYIYIADTFIQGTDTNQSNATQNGIGVNNQGFVLRYVLGV